MEPIQEKICRHVEWYVAAWLVAQSGGLFSILINWETEPPYVAWSALYVTLLALTTAALWWLRRDGAAAWRHLSPRWILKPDWLWPTFGLLLACWALPLEPAYPLDALRWLATTGVALTMVALIRHDFSPLIWRLMPWALGFVVLWFNLLTVDIYPPVYTDEGWNLNKSWSSAHSGILYAPSINMGVHGVPQLINAEPIWLPVGLWMRLMGLGLWQGRLFLSFFAPFMVALTFLAASRLYDRRVGTLAALFAASSVLTLHVSHYMRHDIVLAAAMALGLFIHALVEKRKRFREAFLLGLVLALSVDIHPNAFIYCFAFGIFYLSRTAWLSLREGHPVLDRRLLGLVAGGASGAAIYFALHIAPDPALFFQQAGYYYAINYGSAVPASFEQLRHRLGTSVDHMRSWFAFSLAEGNALLLSAGTTLVTRRATDLSILMLFILCFLGWVVLGSRRTPTYISVMVPLGAMLVGAALGNASRQTRHVLVLGALLLAAVLGITLRHVIVAQRQGVNQQFETCVAALRDRVPEEGVILGEHLFWLARPELTGYASRTLVQRPWEGRTAEEWWAWIDPDIVLWPGPVTGAAAQFVTENSFRLYDLPECEAFLTIWLRPGVEFAP